MAEAEGFQFFVVRLPRFSVFVVRLLFDEVGWLGTVTYINKKEVQMYNYEPMIFSIFSLGT